MITPQKTMWSPAPGFTARVMTRIEDYERARARQRAWLGVILLVVAAIVVGVLVVLTVALWVAALAEQPSIVSTVVTVCVSLFGRARIVLEAFWVAGMTIARNVSALIWIAYALLAVALTMVWTRVAVGFPQFASISIREEER